MGAYDPFDYSIKSRMPEWWKDDGLTKVINEYTQDIIAETLQALLSNLGVVQPLNVWKTIPEEYNWYHHYTMLDDLLEFKEGNVVSKSTCTLFPEGQTTAYLPNTKRKCDARIHLKLLGSNISDKTGKVKELQITNGTQTIVLNNVPKVSNIDIFTETKQVFIDDEERPDLVTGFFGKIQPNIKYDDFQIPTGEDQDGNPTYEEIDLTYENKETKITFDSGNDQVDFDLQIYLLKPTYVIEQNIRISSISAFPIEYVRLYGYFCHPYNNKQGSLFLWEKRYNEDDRTVYDRITKQYDCERFWIEVKFFGIDSILRKGFPQEESATNEVYQLNSQLDKWGKIYGLPRRYYRTDIEEDEEPYTFPKYYNYSVEQDYWYEERLVNEYQYVEGAVNSYFVKDDELNNVARLECIAPTTDELWVYTETVKASDDNERELKDVPVNKIELIDGTTGVEIKDFNNLEVGNPTELTEINPLTTDVVKLNDDSYQTKMYRCSFCLAPYRSEVPKDIKIKGIELKFKTETNLKSNSLTLSANSSMLLPIYSPIYHDFKIGKVNIAGERKFWVRTKDTLEIGGKDFLFGEKEITREQLFSGNNQQLEFEIGFTNESDFLKAELIINSMTLNIYYEVIPDKYDIDIEIPQKTVFLTDDPEIELNLTISNKSNKEIGNKELFIVLPKELQFKDGYYNHYTFSFEKEEPPFTIKTVIEPKEIDGEKRTGYYDILIFCEDNVFKKEILVRSGE